MFPENMLVLFECILMEAVGFLYSVSNDFLFFMDRMVSPSLLKSFRSTRGRLLIRQQDESIIIHQNQDSDAEEDVVLSDRSDTAEQQDDVEVFLAEMRSSPVTPSVVLPMQARKEYVSNLLISKVSPFILDSDILAKPQLNFNHPQSEFYLSGPKSLVRVRTIHSKATSISPEGKVATLNRKPTQTHQQQCCSVQYVF
jgi:hypothetical protein